MTMNLRVSALLTAIVVASAGCGEDDPGGGKAGSGGGSSGSCKPSAESCYVAGAEGPGNECMAKADFSGSAVAELRVASHQVKSPTTLAAPFMQNAIITKKSALFEPTCNLDGTGQFNLLLTVDSGASTLTLAGGVPQALLGPATSGTCYARLDAGGGIVVEPVTAPMTLGSDGQFTATFDSFVLPIYLEDSADAEKAVLMPLHEMTVTGKLSADNNCIGRYAHERGNPSQSCQPGEGQFAWEPAGRYEGYITVTEADEVFVHSLGQTLCVVLTGDPTLWKGPKPDLNCKTSQGFVDNGGLPKGDWCSTTNSAGGCQDSWRLVIDYAAQAIQIGGEYGSGCS